MGYQKSSLKCSQHVLLHVKESKFNVGEDVIDPTYLSETFMGNPDFARPPEMTSPLKTSVYLITL